jgi:ribonuclease T2
MRLLPVWRLGALMLYFACWGCVPRTGAQSGDFDYYVLSLSWSPEFCYGHPDNVECAQHRGFVVHGLWPQFRGRRGPEYCSHNPGASTPRLDGTVMPDAALARHEWEAHGTCTGLSPEAYFDVVRRAAASVRIPHPLVSPDRQLRASPGEIIRSFEQANPGLRSASIQLTCRGAYLQSVNICLTKSLRPAVCSMAHGCREPVVKITAVR